MRGSHLGIAFALLLAASPAGARGAAEAAGTTPAEPLDVTEMTLEQLFDIEVTLASKTPEKLSEVPASIQVLTNEEIRRSGAATLPEALRLAANLQVARVNSHDWAITARGFNGAPLANNSLADKLLVMIDGRTVYTPLFGGVFWDVQQVLLEDVDRIEIVSGSGGTLWGSNAVNGVINVITKSSRDTPGWYASGAGGTQLERSAALRYGGRAGSVAFRVYGQYLEMGATFLPSGAEANDAWGHLLGGFRLDFTPGDSNTVTVHGDVYDGDAGDPANVETRGYNLLGRVTHAFSQSSDMSLQLYVDHTQRELPSATFFADDLTTYDLDFQHRFAIGARQRVLWGVGYRRMRDDTSRSVPPLFVPAARTLDLASIFAQDEVELVPSKLRLLAGVRLERNDFSGTETQPNVRLVWTPGERQSIWGAATRAVRSPSRLDTDIVTDTVVGDPEFESETVTSYELGYRIMPTARITLHVTAFHAEIRDLRTVDTNATPPPALRFGNGQEADAHGVELFGRFQISDRWRLRGGYVYLDKEFRTVDPLVVTGSDLFEAIDPRNHAMLQSLLDLPAHFQLDVAARYVDELPASIVTPVVPAYAAFDVRVSWRRQDWEVAVVGQDLGHRRHPEFGTQEIPSGAYATVAWRH